jgi:hypothetical protein
VAKRKSQEPSGPRPNSAWICETEIQVNGRNVSFGTELKIRGVRGRFRFVKKVTTPTTEWIDVWGGPKGSESMRSFRLEQIKTVHYKNQTVGNLAVEYKEKKAAKKAEIAESQED